MRTRIGLIAIVVLSMTGGVTTQVRPLPAPPDFSGNWAATGTEGLAYSPFGPRFTVKQDARTIAITTDRETMTYNLDDSETRWTTQTVRGATWTRFARARFVTAALVVTTRVDAGATGHWEDLFVIALDKPGEVTVVACSAATAGGMNTRSFKYTKAQ